MNSKKIRGLLSFIITMSLIIPVVTLAQWTLPTSLQAGGLSDASFYEIIKRLLNYLLGFIGVLAVVGFVVAGIMYITAAGDENRMENAKKMLTYSIIGLAVALLSLVILIAIDIIIA
jgi:type IV secretory pathway VirB2 component (pilin)